MQAEQKHDPFLLGDQHLEQRRHVSLAIPELVELVWQYLDCIVFRSALVHALSHLIDMWQPLADMFHFLLC